MRERNLILLIGIVVLAGVAIWIDLPIDHPEWTQKVLFWQAEGTRDLELKEGLDLQGGLQVLLEADVPESEELPDGALDAVKGIIENRVNGLGVTEPLIQIQGKRRIIVELPGIDDPDQAVSTLKGTGRLEFIEAGGSPVPEGTTVRTSLSDDDIASAFVITPTAAITATGILPDAEEQVYPTIMSGKHLKTAAVSTDEMGRPQISFELTSEH